MKYQLIVCVILACITAIVVTFMVMKPVYDCIGSDDPDLNLYVHCIHGR